MAEVRKIRVRAYSGHRADERPICFWVEGKQISVKRILRRWYEQGAQLGGERKSCFQVEGEDGQAYRLCYHQKEDTWFLIGNP